jgi:hypothetical protein
LRSNPTVIERYMGGGTADTTKARMPA